MAAAVGKAWIRNPLTSPARSPRGVLAIAAAIALLLVADPSPISLAAGLPLVIAGEALRTWAAGHLHKTRELATGGPYARLRHPLYLGTLLIAMGFCLMSGFREAAVAGPLFLVFFIGWYIPRKESREGRRLERRHGDHYLAYRAAVPALIPRWHRWQAPAGCRRLPEPWKWSLVRDNDEVGTALAVAACAALLALRSLAG